MKRLFLISLLFTASILTMFAQQNDDSSAMTDSVATTADDSLYVALLTCDPGTDAYKLFGHTAIRVQNKNNPEADFSFNYGIFDFRMENFIYRFVIGETYYWLDAEPMWRFLDRYSEEGIRIYEQELNITSDQKALLAQLLVINAQPENRVYRYNFLYDNCTTRARDIIQRALGIHNLKCEAKGLGLTYRDILHIYTNSSPWTEFGIDMVLGCEVDRPADVRAGEFIPAVYMHDADSTYIIAENGEVKPFVKNTIVYEPKGQHLLIPDFPLSPVVTFWIVFAFVLLVNVFDCYRKKLSPWVDVALLSLQGIAGVVVSFLFFFSDHPAVDTNWLVIAFNPLAFVMIPIVLLNRTKWRKLKMAAECVNMTVLVFLLLLFVLPLQWVNPAVLPLALSLLIRSIIRMKQTRRTFSCVFFHSVNHRF